MLFLIAMIVACVFSWFCAKPLKTHPTPFYVAGAVVSVIMIMIGQIRPEGIPQAVNTYLIGLFNRGALAAALWCVVAYIGAVPDGAKAIRKQLMPSRGELSIFTAILTISHTVTYGVTYIKRLTSGRPVTETTFILTCIICLMLMLIMIPLTVISFKNIRKKMKPKTWKAIQRIAYVFYALIYLHVMVIFIPRAKIGREGALFDVIIYSVVFLGYAVLRIRKALVKTQPAEKHSILNVVCTAVFVLTVGGLGISSRSSITPVQSADTGTNLSTTAPALQTVTETTTAVSTSAETSANPMETISETDSDSISETLTPTEAETAPISTDNSVEETTAVLANAETQASPAVTTAVVATSANVSNEENSAPNDEPQNEPVQDEPAPEPVQNNPAPEPVQNAPEPAPQADPEPVQNTPQPEPQPEPEPEPQQPASVLYNDGTYSADKMGFDSTVHITVTIESDKIIDLTASCNESDMWYFENAYGTIRNAILASQSPDVDVVAESTISSNAIMDGVRDCLNQARK